MLDLNAIDQQYAPLEALEPQLKAARKAWALAVNALEAEQALLQTDTQTLNADRAKIQIGIFSTTNTDDLQAYVNAQIAVNLDAGKIPAMLATVTQFAEAFNQLYAQWQQANAVLTQNPGQVEKV